MEIYSLIRANIRNPERTSVSTHPPSTAPSTISHLIYRPLSPFARLPFLISHILSHFGFYLSFPSPVSHLPFPLTLSSSPPPPHRFFSLHPSPLKHHQQLEAGEVDRQKGWERGLCNVHAYRSYAYRKTTNDKEKFCMTYLKNDDT